MPTAQKDSGPVNLRRLQDSILEIPIEGLTPVIPHRWAEKAKAMMRAKHAGENLRGKRTPKNPQEDANDATYWLPDGQPAMPAVAFKAATVGACRFFEGLPMTRAKVFLFVEGVGTEQLVPVFGTIEMHEDTPRNADGGADLRYRNYIVDWKAKLTVRFVDSIIDAGSLVSLVDAGGRLGVGDWRPSAPKSSTGTYGQYRVIYDEMKDV